MGVFTSIHMVSENPTVTVRRDDTHLEYRLLIEIAHSRITRARVKLEAAQ